MDKKIANNVIVGIFVTLAAVAFTFMLFNMGGGKGFLSSNYKLYARFKEVKGLHKGSEIALSGLRIGTVDEINVAADDTRELIVTLSIEKKMYRQIRQDSSAIIRTQGVLGDKYIELSIGTPSSDELKPGSFISAREESDLFRKSGNLVEGISRHFDKGGDIEKLIENLNILAMNLGSMTSELKRNKSVLNELFYGKTGESLNRSILHFEEILKKINKGDGTLGSIINDPSIYEDLRALMGGAKRSTVLKYFMRQFIEDGDKAKKDKP